MRFDDKSGMEPPVPNPPATEREVLVPANSPSAFPTNKITTSKYTYLTFLPKNLYEQFHKLVNIYFLSIAFMQATPVITVSNGVPNILVPLVFVLTVSAVKDFLEDFKRRQSDTEENTNKVQTISDGGWKDTAWKDLHVGDIVQVKETGYFPADLMLLSASDAKGVCYVETKNIDGETNLKHKSAIRDLHNNYQTEAQLVGFQATINCDLPNSSIYNFQGRVTVGEVSYPLDINQMLLRGSSLRNTHWIIGVVVYSGHDTKLMQNSADVRFKYSQVEDNMSYQIIYVIILQVILCVLCAGYYTTWYWLTSDNTEQYLDLDSHHDSYIAQFVIQFFSWMLIFTNFVPISLIVTLEMVKFFQAFFICWDLRMYYEETDTPATVQSSNLNEELGQITHIFSDKTGTLTCNVMEFRKFSMHGVAYGSNQHITENKPLFVDFVHPDFEITQEVIDFMWVLAVCHTVIAERKDDGTLEYKAASPDELALVHAAKFFHVEFTNRTEDNILMLEVNGVPEELTLLNVLEFTSDRKRMSVIVRKNDGSIRLLCKGADSVVKARLIDTQDLPETEKHMEDFANEGLRTLMVAERIWEPEEYEDWNARWEQALQSIGDREAQKSALAEEAERGMRLLGATAIEDRLQDGVASAISALRKAGIHVWMLTGDKIETAINIGFACSLLTPHMPQISITGTTRRIVRQEITQARHALKIEPAGPFALVISGEALTEALKDDCVKDFVKVADRCDSVLCCRVSPQQKAAVVHAVMKHRVGVRVLAIGDGANDVNMITAAHVGVGIAGLEGTQAVRASDFSIAQFRFLQRLLFVHGHECYRRNATLICYNFYKNMLLVLPLFWYGLISTFSGQILYNMWTYNFFNMLYAFMPIFVYALFDKEMDHAVLEQSPRYYKAGLKQELFSTNLFWQSIGQAAIKSIFICFITFLGVCFFTGDADNGKDSNIWLGSLTMYLVIVIVANLRILMFSYSVTWFSIVIMIGSVGMFVFTHFILLEWLPISTWFDNYDMKGSIYKLFFNPNVYNVLILLVAICFILYPMVRHSIEIVQILRKRSLEGEGGSVTDDEDDDDKPLLEEQDRYSRYTGIITRKYTGFAFSQEAGNAPQITDSLMRRSA